MRLGAESGDIVGGMQEVAQQVRDSAMRAQGFEEGRKQGYDEATKPPFYKKVWFGLAAGALIGAGVMHLSMRKKRSRR